ncbi:MAG TPA: hypothetical protein VMF32_24645 [Xanthobacteraceae bacterium]|nr:hypothetical protein [Xanthobacteraceae bacterium]
MSERNHPPLYDQSALGSVSRRLSSAIFSVMPELHQYASTIHSGETDGMSLNLVIPSPTGDEARLCQVWVDEAATPSIGFGPSHTHEPSDDAGIAAIVGLLRAILADQLLIIEDVGGTYSGHGGWIDLRDPEALEEELTSPYSPGHALLKSWSGKVDRPVSVDTLAP